MTNPSDLKFEKPTLPTSKKQALDMAMQREEWAIAARMQHKDGSAKEFELTALLLYFIAKHL